MNLNNWSPRRKFIAILGVILVIAGIAGTIFIVQKRQETRIRAEKSTTLTLTPPSQNVAPGRVANLDLNIDPGENQVNLVKVTLKYDPDRFSMTESDFTLDPASELEVINGPVVGAGSFSVVLGTGSDPTKVIRSAQKIGSLILKVSDSAEVGSSDVQFEYAQTEVRSSGATDTYLENVLSSATPATITVEAVCRPNVASCSWDSMGEGMTYNYVITNVTDDVIVAEDTTEEVFVEFAAEPGKTYRCEVSAENSCGVGDAGEATESCDVPSGTPTPSPEISTTPTPDLSVTPTPSVTLTPTVTEGLTPTPTRIPSLTPTFTPTPTTPEEITSTPTENVDSPTPTDIPVETTSSSLPPTGNPFMILGGLIGGVFIVVGGLMLLFL